ncbi:MAG: hypothetical protein C0622_03490 [Desulfuromonas sp.]|nr:MAG: hypothetical protein C0622_03490 [Desulfuromonas sp.]
MRINIFSLLAFVLLTACAPPVDISTGIENLNNNCYEDLDDPVLKINFPFEIVSVRSADRYENDGKIKLTIKSLETNNIKLSVKIFKYKILSDDLLFEKLNEEKYIKNDYDNLIRKRKGFVTLKVTDYFRDQTIETTIIKKIDKKRIVIIEIKEAYYPLPKNWKSNKESIIEKYADYANSIFDQI